MQHICIMTGKQLFGSYIFYCHHGDNTLTINLFPAIDLTFDVFLKASFMNFPF